MTCACGKVATASVTGKNGGRVPVCDSCIDSEPEAVYRIPNHPHVTRREVTYADAPAAIDRALKPAFDNMHAGLAEPMPRITKKQLARVRAESKLPPIPGDPADDRISGFVLARPVVLVLPEPPSANRWWRRHGTTMHLSREAKAYKYDVAMRASGGPSPELPTSSAKNRELISMRPAFPQGPVSVVVVWRRDRKAGDLDKRLGVLLDALQGVVYASDAQVVQIWARRCDEHPTLQPGTVRVEVSAV